MAVGNPYAFEGSQEARAKLQAAYRLPPPEEALGVSMPQVITLLEWTKAARQSAQVLGTMAIVLTTPTRNIEDGLTKLQTAQALFGQEDDRGPLASTQDSLAAIDAKLTRSAALMDELTTKRTDRVEDVQRRAETLRGDFVEIAREAPGLRTAAADLQAAVAQRAAGVEQAAGALREVSVRIEAQNKMVDYVRTTLHGPANSDASFALAGASGPTAVQDIAQQVHATVASASANVRDLQPFKLLPSDVEARFPGEKSNADSIADAAQRLDRLVNEISEGVAKLARDLTEGQSFPRQYKQQTDPELAHQVIKAASLLPVIRAGLNELAPKIVQDTAKVAAFNEVAGKLSTTLTERKVEFSQMSASLKGAAAKDKGIAEQVDPYRAAAANATNQRRQAEGTIRKSLEARIEAQDPSLRDVLDLKAYTALNADQQKVVVRALVAESGFAAVYGKGGLDTVKAGKETPRMPDTVRHLADVRSANEAAQQVAKDVLPAFRTPAAAVELAPVL